MINIKTLHSGLVEENDELAATFATIAERDLDQPTQALLDTVIAGLTAIHKRQGDHITLMLRTNQ